MAHADHTRDPWYDLNPSNSRTLLADNNKKSYMLFI